MSWLVRVDLPHTVFGFVVGEDGIVLEAAPIAAWAKGKKGRDVVRYFRQRGATVEVLEPNGEAKS